MKRIITFLGKICYGGQDREFLKRHREELRDYNCRISTVIVVISLCVIVILADIGFTQGKDPYILTVRAFFMVIFLMLLAWKTIIGPKINGNVFFIFCIEAEFLLLLCSEIILDPKATVCFMPTFFMGAFIISAMAFHKTFVLMTVDFLFYASITWSVRPNGLALEDISSSFVAFVVGAIIGINILRNRYSEIDMRDTIEEKTEAKVALAMEKVNKDALTGVQSRAAYIGKKDVLNELIAEDKAEAFAVIVCDCDDLKTINDTMGHMEGDKIIIETSKILCNIFRHSPVYRMGGDEFLVILQNKDYEMRKKLIKILDNHLTIRPGEASISYGVGEYRPGEKMTYAHVLVEADKAMYRMKKSQHSNARETI